jgi:hypothetical protein
VTAPTVDMGADTFPIRGGWRVKRPDGTCRTVLLRQSGDGYAVFTGSSTDTSRWPALGYPGSWFQAEGAAVEWARTAVAS